MVILFATQEAIQSIGENNRLGSFSSIYLPSLEKHEAPRVLEQVGECGRRGTCLPEMPLWRRAKLVAKQCLSEP